MENIQETTLLLSTIIGAIQENLPKVRDIVKTVVEIQQMIENPQSVVKPENVSK